jgi:hypothetical protein
MSLGRLNDTAMKLRQENRALSLRQLGAAYGLGYTRIKQMQAMPGFPQIAGKVIPSDFDQWRLIRTTGLSSLHRGDRLRSAVDTTRALKSKSDLPTSWRQIANSLKDEAWLHELHAKSENSDV